MARILLIDDDDAVRTLVRLTLGRCGHTVVEAHDGEEGLELFPRVNADLLITDLVMPGKGGLAMLAELREKFPAVKAIVMSGGARRGPDDLLDLAKCAGAARVLDKPFLIETLLAAVNEVLAAGDAASDSESRDRARERHNALGDREVIPQDLAGPDSTHIESPRGPGRKETAAGFIPTPDD